MRRKRSLQSLAVAPKPPFGKDAANGGLEPNPAIDFSRCVCSQRKNFRSCIEDSATKQRTSRSFVTHKAKSSDPTYKLRDYR